MSMGAENLGEGFQIAGEIFDRYAEARQQGEVTKDLGNRAVAAAAIIAYVSDVQEWPDILDGALKERGISSHYSELSPDKLRGRSRSASDQTSHLTKRCRSVLEELRALNTFDTEA
jgi:hypothetical protein